MTKSRSGFGRFSPIAFVKRMTVVEWLVIAGIFFLIGSILAPTLQRMRETTGHLPCPSNLRQLGQAMLLYSHDNGGWYPDRLETLAVTQDITTEVFVCPSSGDERAEQGPTTQAILASFASGKHLSYIYIASGFRMDELGSDDVVAYEPVTNHDGDGSNMLFGDGHVNFEETKEVARTLALTKAHLEQIAAKRKSK